jgi:hypothetical protein
MKHHFFCIIIISLLGMISFKAPAQVNTDAIDAYWQIVEELKQDRDPSAEVWRTFFDRPGNQLALKYHKNPKEKRDSIRRAFQLVYMPGKREQLQNTRVDVFLENIIYTRDHEAAIKDHIAFVKEGPAVVDSMYQAAYRYLPAYRHKRIKGLKIYYIGPLTPDSKALDNAFFINTAIEVRFFPKRRAYVGAHELHHLLLNQQTRYHFTTKDHERFFGIALMAKHLHREGLADLIDKKFMQVQQEDSFYYPLLVNDLQQSDSMITKLNAELERAARSPESQPQVHTLISRGGHAPGHYMALVIERNGYLPELLKTIYHPFTFLYIYNKAAQKDAQKPAQFSPAAIAFLRRIEVLFP